MVAIIPCFRREAQVIYRGSSLPFFRLSRQQNKANRMMAAQQIINGFTEKDGLNQSMKATSYSLYYILIYTIMMF